MKHRSQSSFSSNLKVLLAAHPHKTLTLGEILHTLKDKSFGLCLMLMALPGSLPVYGISVPLGFLMMILGLQMAFGLQSPSIPKRARTIRIKTSLIEKVLKTSDTLLAFMQSYIRPRCFFMFSGLPYRVLGGLVFVMAFLVFLPLTLTNTLPGILIFILGACLSQEDGLISLLWIGVALLTAVLFAGAAYGIVVYGWAGIHKLKDCILSYIF